MRDTESIDGGIGEIEQAHGPVEVLVANAGMTRDQLLMRMSDEEFEEVLDVNLTGVFRCVRRVSKGMIRKRVGRIIHIGRAHVCTPVTWPSRIPSSALINIYLRLTM